MAKTKEQVLEEAKVMAQRMIKDSITLALEINQLSKPDSAWVEASLQEYSENNATTFAEQAGEAFEKEFQEAYPDEQLKPLPREKTLKERIEEKMNGK